MLATVRSFVRRLCEGTGELDVAGRELARHYLGRLGPQIDRLDSHLLSERQRELDNLRGLLSVQPPLGALLAEELACVVVPTAARISPLAAIDEGQRYLQVLSHPSSGRVALLVIVSALLGNAGQLNVASSMLDEADVQTQVVGVPDWLEGQIENTRGAIAIHRGQPDVAEGIARAALAGARTAGARQRLFNLLGIALLEQDKLDAAREAQSQALAASTEMDNRALSAITQNNLAEIALRAGDAATAARFQAQVLRAAMEMGSLVLLASTLIVAARLADGLEDSSAAARLQAAANVQLAGLGWVMNPSDQQLSDDVLARAAARLGASQYQAELEAGAGRPVEAAIADAQSVFARAAAQPGHA
jgi:hypothetical protein